MSAEPADRWPEGTRPNRSDPSVQSDGSDRSERFESVAIPVRWPSAWPYLSHLVYRRARFVLAVVLLTAAGIVLTGEPGAQWWVPLLPVVLLVGPVRRPGRLRRAFERAARRGDLAAMPGRLHPGPVNSRGQTVRLVTPTGDAVAVPVRPGVAEALAVRHVGEPVLLVWARRPPRRSCAALLLRGCLVAYLERVPRHARPTGVSVRLVHTEHTLIPVRR